MLFVAEWEYSDNRDQVSMQGKVMFSGQQSTLKMNLILLAGAESGRNDWTLEFERPSQTL